MKCVIAGSTEAGSVRGWGFEAQEGDERVQYLCTLEPLGDQFVCQVFRLSPTVLFNVSQPLFSQKDLRPVQPALFNLNDLTKKQAEALAQKLDDAYKESPAPV